MTGSPTWRRAFDGVERQVGPPLRSLTSSSELQIASHQVHRVIRAVTGPVEGLVSWGLHVAGLPVARGHTRASTSTGRSATGTVGASSRGGRRRARAGGQTMSPARAPGAGCRPCHQAGGRAHATAGAQGHRAHRPPTAPYDQHDAEGRGVVARQGHALALPQAPGASGPPVMLFLGLVGDSAIFDLHPGNLLGRKTAERGFRRLPLRLGQARGRRGRPHPRHVPQWLLRPCRRRRAAHHGGGARSSWAPTAWGRSCSCCCSAAAVTSRRPTSSCSRRRATSSMPRRSSTTSARGGCSLGHHRRDDGPRAGGRHPRHVPLAPTDVRVVQYVTLWEHLWRDEYVHAHRAVKHWAWNHRPMAGAAFTELITEYVRDNALMSGGARLGGRPVELKNVTMPTLIVVAERDEFVPPATRRCCRIFSAPTTSRSCVSPAVMPGP